MKKVYQIISAISFSMLVIGANAQIAPAKGNLAKPHVMKLKQPTRSANHNTHKVTGLAQNVLIDYVNGDIVYTGNTFATWTPALYMDMYYGLADTNYSPFVTNAANKWTPNYATVTYDTLWDFYSQTFISPSSIKPGSAAVDTIWADLEYSNASGMNDTIVFEIDAVDANGFPAATKYGSVTMVITPTTLPYNNQDSQQFVPIVPAAPIVIPASARQGWNFCIKAKVYCATKADTVGLWYLSQYVTCGSGDITNAYSQMGVPDGHVGQGGVGAVNSWITGLWWFNSTIFSGTNKQMTWPSFGQASYNGYCQNGSYYWYNQSQAPTCADTDYFPVQDIAMYASISYLDPTGINEVSANGFSVSQNFPNPFSNQTQITYNLTKSSDVVFSVYDLTGRELMNNNLSTVAPGQHVININANQFSPGVYLYTFNVNGNLVTKRMVIQ
jgi:hypothetical protein